MSLRGSFALILALVAALSCLVVAGTVYFVVGASGAGAPPLRTWLVGTSAGVVVLSWLVGAVAAGRMLRPLGRARDAARRLHAGHLSTRLPDQGRDEVKAFTRSFNEMADELERRTGELNDLKAQYQQFVSDVSRELSIPLNGLNAAAQALQSRGADLDEEGRMLVHLLVAEILRMRTLIDELMELARIECGLAAMNWEKLDVGEVLETAIKTRGWTGRVTFRLPMELFTFADRNRLDAMVGHLVNEALESGAPPVILDASAEGDHLRMEVADGRPQMLPEQASHIFDRFYVVNPSRPDGQGTRLGLTIAREYARLHGGDITVESRPGLGCVFVILMPLRKVDPGTGAQTNRSIGGRPWDAGRRRRPRGRS